MISVNHVSLTPRTPALKQKISTEVLKSLPGGLWEKYGSSGWGPESNEQFMQFDYGGVNAYLGHSGVFSA